MAITYTLDFKGQAAGISNAITSNSLTVSTGDFLTAIIVFGDENDADTFSIANNGTAIVWTNRAETTTASNCKVVLYSGIAGATPPTTVTVTRDTGGEDNGSKALTVIAHTGAHATTPLPAGNIFTGVGGTDASQSITPTSSGSALWMVAGDWSATNTFAAATNCTLAAAAFHDAGWHTSVAVRPTTQPRTDAAAFTIGETDTGGKIAWVAFEVQAAGDGSTPLKRNLPQFIAKGAFSGSAAAAAPTMPTFNAGDLLVLVQVSANQAITVPGTYTEVSSSPQFTGTAAVAGGIRLSVSTRVAVAGDAAPTLTDTGNMNAAQIYSFRGIDTASPINVQAGTTQAATASVVFSNPTTTTDNCLILNVFGNDRDIGASGNLTSVTNAALANLTTQHDECVAAGVGGGLALITGQKLTAGVVGGTTATNGASVTNASITIALQGSPKIPDWTITQKFTPLRM